MHMKKRTTVRIFSFLAVATIAIVGFCVITNNKIERLETERSNAYSMNLSELDGSLYNISVALQKCLYASSATQLNNLAVELCAESTVAKNSLSQLSYHGQELENVNKLLSQVGDYPLYLSKKVIQGGSIDDNERELLYKLSNATASVSTTVNNICTEYEENGNWSGDITDEIESSVSDDFSTKLEGLEELLIDYPSLIYDGPFSDHMLSKDMKMLKGTEELSVDEAIIKAEKILGISLADFKREEDTAGNVPCYNFTDGNTSFSITKQGGFVIYMRKFREIKEQTYSYNQAVEIAKEYLKKASGTNFIENYYFADEGVCTINFAHKEGATVCYPDLIKVGVSLDNGEVVLLEAGGYLANHYTRTISTPKYSIEQAQEKLSKTLTVQSVRRVIIPTDGNQEKHCYEFACKGLNGEDLLVYVNVSNLEEEQILLLLKTDGGTLTK